MTIQLKVKKEGIRMKVQIWSDFVCPFCYIGERHLLAAIKEVDPSIEVEYMSYELDPNHVDTPGVSMAELLASKYGMSVEEAQANNDRVTQMAHAAGLDYRLDIAQHSNTFKAHKIFQYAKTKGLGNELAEVFMDAYFTKGIYINSDDELVRLSGQVGIDEETVRFVLDNDDFGLKVRQDEQNAANLGVKGVPHFVIDDQVFLSGAQPVATFKDALLHVKTLNFNNAQNDMMCEDGLCVVKES